MIIRDMTPADHREASEILTACFRWLAEREGLSAPQLAFLLSRATEATVEEESKTRRHLVACKGDAILGMAVVNRNQIARLYVHPRHHRQGVGRALFMAAQDLIRASGFTEATVGALVASAAAFYRAMGMHDVEEVEYEPQIFNDRKVLILRKPLG